MGHDVEIYDAGTHSGGLLWTGVPHYRLPKEILDTEINRIVKMGVNIRLNYKVTDVLMEKEAGNFDVVYLAIVAQLIHSKEFPQDKSVHITDAFSFFNEVRSNTSPYIQKKVVVYGGVNWPYIFQG